MTFDHDFGYSFPFSLPSQKKEWRRKGEWSSKNRDQKSCLSAWSYLIYMGGYDPTTCPILYVIVELKFLHLDWLNNLQIT